MEVTIDVDLKKWKIKLAERELDLVYYEEPDDEDEREESRKVLHKAFSIPDNKAIKELEETVKEMIDEYND